MFEFTPYCETLKAQISAIENDVKVKHGAGAERLSGSETSPNTDSEQGPQLAKRVKQLQPLEMGEKHSSNTLVLGHFIFLNTISNVKIIVSCTRSSGTSGCKEFY